jgi:hypothetical protein
MRRQRTSSTTLPSALRCSIKRRASAPSSSANRAPTAGGLRHRRPGASQPHRSRGPPRAAVRALPSGVAAQWLIPDSIDFIRLPRCLVCAPFPSLAARQHGDDWAETRVFPLRRRLLSARSSTGDQTLRWLVSGRRRAGSARRRRASRVRRSGRSRAGRGHARREPTQCWRGDPRAATNPRRHRPA